MLSNNQITQINDKKVCERINCPRCNKPNMSKKNISAHYKAGCSGIWDQYDQKKVKEPKEPKEPKEKKPRQPRKSRNKNISFSCSDFIDFTNWLIENQVILDGDDQDQFYECYQQFKNNETYEFHEPMIIKIKYPWSKEKEEVQEVQEEVQFDDIYPEEESFKNENGLLTESGSRAFEMITPIEELPKMEESLPIQEIIKPILNKPVKLGLRRKPRRSFGTDTEGVKEKPAEESVDEQVEQSVCNALNWHFNNNNKPKIDPEDEFFLEDENIEKEFPGNTEEQIKLRLNKFMERWDDKEIKSYSNDQKKRIDHIIRKEKIELNGLNRMTNIELFKNKSKYNFILRNLINLIKVKLDQLEDEGLSQEESLKKFNEFDKNKIIKKYNDKFNHWADRARDTYQIPKGNEWTITTRERPEPTDD